MHGLFRKHVIDTVLDAVANHEQLGMQVLDSRDKGRELAQLILRLLMGPERLANPGSLR